MTLNLVVAALGLAGVAGMALLLLAVRRELLRTRAELAERVAALMGQLHTSLGSRLDAAQGHIGSQLRETQHAMADLREQLGQLGEATRQLQTVGEGVSELQQLLRVPKLRGGLGEVWLEQLLDQIFPAGLYRRQYAFRNGERVDAALFIGDRIVAIDSKFPLEACQRMLAASEADAGQARRAFRASFKQRIDEIASKYIRPEEGTFDFALMYVPAEGVYYEAVVRDADDGSEGMLAYAMQRKVIPVSPHTFYAYLSAVIHGLRGLHVEEWARELRDELSGLGQQFDRYWASYQKVGSHLANAEKQYRESELQGGRVRDHLERLADPGRLSRDSGPPAKAVGDA